MMGWKRWAINEWTNERLNERVSDGAWKKEQAVKYKWKFQERGRVEKRNRLKYEYKS